MFDNWDARTWSGFLLIGILPVISLWMLNIGKISFFNKIGITIGLPLIAWYFIERKK